MQGGRQVDLTLRWSNRILDLGRRTHVMGILNVTPDSFSDGGRYLDRDKAVDHGLSMARDGADIIDVGGESTRPSAEKISSDEELDRVISVIERICREVTIPVSIDTYKSAVAREALKAGASMINDISALRFDPHMAAVAARAGVPVILMHMKGTPETMQSNPTYEALVPEILDFLRVAMDRATNAGIRRDLILVDPGIGFGKTFDDNLKIIRDLSQFAPLGRPILLGTSNKAFIGHILNKELHERDIGTMATVAVGVLNGAHLVRVHDVKKAVETVRMVDAVKRGRSAE
jgi:dihydropteroate synthase